MCKVGFGYCLEVYAVSSVSMSAAKDDEFQGLDQNAVQGGDIWCAVTRHVFYLVQISTCYDELVHLVKLRSQ